MALLGLAAGFLTILVAGLGVTLLVRDFSRPQSVLEVLCFSWIFGTGVISLLLWLGGFLISGHALQGGVTVAAIAIGWVGFRKGPKQGWNLSWPRPRAPVEWLLCTVILLELGAGLFLSVGHTLGWDGSFNWEIKARLAFLNNGIIPAQYYTSPSHILSHPEYPLLIPMTELWLDLWLGVAHQFWIKLIFSAFQGAGWALLAILGSRLSGRRWVGLLGAALLFFVPYLAVDAGGLRSGYLDFPLGVLYLATIGYLLLYAATGEATPLKLYLLSLALLPWLKRDGMILWLVAVACGCLVFLRSRANWRLFAGLLPGLILMFFWQLYLKNLGANPPHDFVAISFATLHGNLDRLWPIWRTVLFELVRGEHWSLLWLMAGMSFCAHLARRPGLGFTVLWTAIVAPVILYSCSYVFSAWPDYIEHMHASIARLLLHVTPLAWLAIALGWTWSQKGAPAAKESRPNEERKPLARAAPLPVS